METSLVRSTFTPSKLLAAFAAAWLLLHAWPAQAETPGGDYQLAIDLLSRQSPRFHAEDLAERIAAKLEASPSAMYRLEAKMVRAALLRTRARTAGDGMRGELLSQARKLYAEFIAVGQNHPLLELCRAEAAGMEREAARALMASAEKDPATAAEKRKEAAEILAGIAADLKAEAEKLRPALAEAFKKYDAYVEQRPEARVPQELIDACRRALTAFVPADKKQVLARMEEIEAFAATDPKRKARAAEAAAYCKSQMEWEPYFHPGLEPVVMWFGFAKGRAHALAMEDKQAEECWREALDLVDENADRQAAKEAKEIELLIARESVKLKLRAAAGSPEKYAEAAEAVKHAEKRYADLAGRDIGKDLLIDGATALAKKRGAEAGDYESAVRMLRAVVVKGGPWAGSACRTLAEILDLARKNGETPLLGAQDWFDAAHGCFLEGQIAFRSAKERRDSGEAAAAAELLANGRGQFEQAAQMYRKAIETARKNAVKDPLARLTVEPRAWLEMGLSHVKLEAHAEALLAFDALRTQFGPEGLANWWKEMPNARVFLMKSEVKAAIEKLERVDAENFQNDGILHAGEAGLLFAFERFRARHPGEPPPVTPKGWKEEEAMAGRRLMDEAQARKGPALKALLEGRTEEGVKLAREALAKYREAAAAFESVPGLDKHHEVALYHAPACHALAQGLAAEKAFASRIPAEDAEALRTELGRKALDGFAAYETYLARQSPQDTETFSRRERYARALSLTRAAVYYNLKQWAEAAAACDAFLNLERERPQAPESPRVGDAQFLKFQALIQIAGEMASPECDAPLDAAREILPELKEQDDRHAFALQSLIAKYSAAAERAREAKRPAAVRAAYHSKIADLLALAEPQGGTPSLDDLIRRMNHLREAGRVREAADIAELALKIYDPKKKNAHIDDEAWPAIYERMTRIIRYDDLEKWARCKKDHLALLDFLYETRQGAANSDHPEKRPEHDRHPVSYEKALAQLATIRANYPDCATNRPAPGKAEHLLDGKSFLQAIEDEIVLRRRLIALRDALIDLALEAAEQAEEKDPAAAVRSRALADEQIHVLMETWYGETPSMKIKSAQIRAANKDYDGAEQMLLEVKASQPDTSTEIYVRASRMLSETYFKMKRFEDAAEYPQFLRGLGMRNGWAPWPDVEDFLERCYARGAWRPAARK